MGQEHPGCWLLLFPSLCYHLGNLSGGHRRWRGAGRTQQILLKIVTFRVLGSSPFSSPFSCMNLGETVHPRDPAFLLCKNRQWWWRLTHEAVCEALKAIAPAHSKCLKQCTPHLNNWRHITKYAVYAIHKRCTAMASKIKFTSNWWNGNQCNRLISNHSLWDDRVEPTPHSLPHLITEEGGAQAMTARERRDLGPWMTMKSSDSHCPTLSRTEAKKPSLIGFMERDNTTPSIAKNIMWFHCPNWYFFKNHISVKDALKEILQSLKSSWTSKVFFVYYDFFKFMLFYF